MRDAYNHAPPQLINAPDCPPLAKHVWGYFLDLSPTRGSTGFGPARLTRQEIRLWEADEGITLDRWERNAVMKIDAAYIQHCADEQKREA